MRVSGGGRADALVAQPSVTLTGGSLRLAAALADNWPTCRVAESAEVAAAKEAKMNPYQLEWKEHGSLLYLVSRHNRLAFE